MGGIITRHNGIAVVDEYAPYVYARIRAKP